MPADEVIGIDTVIDGKAWHDMANIMVAARAQIEDGRPIVLEKDGSPSTPQGHTHCPPDTLSARVTVCTLNVRNRHHNDHQNHHPMVSSLRLILAICLPPACVIGDGCCFACSADLGRVSKTWNVVGAETGSQAFACLSPVSASRGGTASVMGWGHRRATLGAGHAPASAALGLGRVRERAAGGASHLYMSSPSPSGGGGLSSSSLCSVPRDLGQALEMCGGALTAAVQGGKRGLTVDILTPDLDPSSRGYDRANLHALLAGTAAHLRKLVAGDVIFVFMDKPEADAAMEAFGMSVVLADDMAEGMIGVSTISDGVSQPLPDVVVLVAPANTKERKVTGEVRVLLQECSGAITLVLNQALDAPGPNGAPLGTLPREFDALLPAFYVEPFALQVDAKGGDPQPPLRIVMTRAYPGVWGVWGFEEDDQAYVAKKDYGQRKPSQKLLLEVCKDIVKERSRRGAA